jgi:hypothetical protein
MKKFFFLALLFSSLILLGGCLKTRTENIAYFLAHQISTGDTIGPLCINEFCARGSNYLVDELNPGSDHWIELYNRTSSTIYFDSTNFYMSVDSTKHSISGMTKLTHYSVPPKGWIVVFADDSDRVVTTPNGHIHIPHISKQGGFIGLYSYSPTTSTLTTLTSYAYDSIPASGDSWGVYPDGSGNWNLYSSSKSTPNAANATP